MGPGGSGPTGVESAPAAAAITSAIPITTIANKSLLMPNPVTGEPGIWYSSGRISATLDVEGNLTSIDSTGTLVDLCPELAS